MTVSASANRVTFNCDGVTYVFPFSFKAYATTDIDVYLLNTTTGVQTDLTINVDFTVTLSDPGPGGEITLIGNYGPPCPPGVIPPAGHTLTIIRQLPLSQLIDFTHGDSMPEDSIEEGLDRAVMLLQELNEKIARALMLPVSSEHGDLELPEPSALKALRWNATADALENVDLFSLGTLTVSELWQSVLDDADLATSLASLGLDPSLASLVLPDGVTISAFAKTLLDDADAATARGTLEAIGSSEFASHAARHKSAGADPIRLDELAAPTDVTTLNASTTAHGLLAKLSNVVTQFLNGQGSWAALKPSDCIQYCTLFIPAEAMTPTITSGAAPGMAETTTYDNMFNYLAFDGATEEFATFNVAMPEEWDRGTVKAKFYWIPALGCSAGDKVEWEIAAIALSDDDGTDSQAAGNQVIYDTVLAGTSGDLHVSAATPAITIAGSPALGDLVQFRISRNVGSANDDMPEDALLVGVLIQYGVLNSQPAAW